MHATCQRAKWIDLAKVGREEGARLFEAAIAFREGFDLVVQGALAGCIGRPAATELRPEFLDFETAPKKLRGGTALLYAMVDEDQLRRTDPGRDLVAAIRASESALHRESDLPQTPPRRPHGFVEKLHHLSHACPKSTRQAPGGGEFIESFEAGDFEKKSCHAILIVGQRGQRGLNEINDLTCGCVCRKAAR